MDKYQITVQTFNDVAELYWHKFKDFELYQPSYDNFLKQLNQKPANLLEIACGPGHVSRYLLDNNPAIKIFGIDLAPMMIEQAIQHNPKATYQVMDCRKINELAATFDAVMCGFCIPYISWQDSQKLIKAMALKLNNGGVLYLSTTEGNKAKEGFQGSKSAKGGVYLHYHDINEVLSCLKQTNLEILSVNKLTHVHNELPTTDVFILAKKQG